MGEPLLLLQAASSYRGDLEDRRTAILVVGLNDHRGFLEEFLRWVGVHEPYQGARVRTQQIYRIDDAQKRVRVDMVVRLLTGEGATGTLVFIECKFNPATRMITLTGFPQSRGLTSSTALQQEAVAPSAGWSRSSLTATSTIRLDPCRRSTSTCSAGVKSPSWRAAPAGRAGGKSSRATRAQPRRNASCWRSGAYLKGDVAGALEDDDLVAIGRTDQAWNRVWALLERVSEILGWDAVYSDWTTLEGTTTVNYISAAPPDDSWLAGADDGWLYVAITNNEWDSVAAVGEPQIYAGWGVAPDREQLESLAQSPWPDMLRRAGLVPIFDRDGAYAFVRRDLRDFVTPASTISAQAQSIVDWARTAVDTALRAPQPEV